MATIEGRNPVIEAIKNDREIDKIMISNSAKEGSIKKIIAMAKEKNLVVQYVDKNKLDEISTSHAHQGVIAQVSEYKYYELDELIDSVKEKGEDPFFIILDEITDPHNLGSIIRTADAVGAHGVIIPKRRSVHITPIVAKASAGAVEYMPVCKVTNIVNTIKRLKEEGLWIAAADMDGQTFYEQNLTGPIGLVIGSEGRGISKERYGEVSLGKGLVINHGSDKNYSLNNDLLGIAENNFIPYQEICTRPGGTNTDIIQKMSGAITTHISIGIRNLHTPVEVCDWSDVEGAIKLLVSSIKEGIL